MTKNKSETAWINIPLRAGKEPSQAVKIAPSKVRPSPRSPVAVVPKKEADTSYHELFQKLYDGVIISDIKGVIMDLNVRGMDFFQYDRSEIRGLSVIDMISGADDSLLATIRQNLEQSRLTLIEAYCIRKGGEAFPSEIAVSWLQSGGEPLLCFLIRDITRRKLAEEAAQQSKNEMEQMNRRLQENQAQLLQSEKMAAIGQIAAGVAHEINNPVGFVTSNLITLTEYVGIFKRLLAQYDQLVAAVESGNVEEQRRIVGELETIRSQEDLPFVLRDIDHLLSESVEGNNRVKEIVQNLKSFARLDESELKEANINDGIEATLKVIWNELKYKCQVEKKLGQIPSIRCYPGQLNQVFMNLLVNAAQAIPVRGNITIVTETNDKHIVIRISDTGTGIAPANIPKIFTPFFTTKPVGKGTGLGLPISYGIVQKHNGTIQVESMEGKGTTFTIRLPLEGVSP